MVLTDRLRLRPVEADDVEVLAPIFAKEEVWRYPYGRGLNRDETASFVEAQRSHWEKHGFGVWIASERATSRVIGYVGLAVPTFLPEILPAVEVGWRLDPEMWGRGYATEGAGAALDDAFGTVGLDEVCSLPQSDNLPSVRVAQRLGMRMTGEINMAANDRHGAVVISHFLITRPEWTSGR